MPIATARVLLKYLSRVLWHKAAGRKLSAPWQEVMDRVLPGAVKSLVKKYGPEFVTREFKRYNINANFDYADGAA
jgi:hypothetical protein